MIIITHEFAPFRGGVAVYSAELAAALARAGAAVEVWAPDYGVGHMSETFGFSFIRLRAGGSLGFGDQCRLALGLWNRRRELESSTVVLTSVGAHLIFMILAPLELIRCHRVLSVIHGSEVLRFERSPLWKFWANRFFPKVACMFAVSRFTGSLIKGSFLSSLAGRIVIAPCACSTAAMQPVSLTNAKDGKIRILTLARVHPRKGQLDVAEALALLSVEWRTKVIYQIGGKGDTEYLQRVAQTCREAGVLFEDLGEITDTLAQTYAQCDIFAMTSRTLPRSVEGFGIAYLEAGFHGKPVVAYCSGGVAEAVVDGETGILLGEGDVTGLTQAFQRLISDAALRQRLGEGGRKRAAEFSWDKTAEVLLEAEASL